MVIFHMHKRSIRICLTVIIPSLETGRVPVIDSLAFQKPAEQFQVFLITAFTFPSAMHKNGMLLFTDLFQKLTDLLKILRPCFLHYRKALQILLIQERYGFLYFLEHFCFPFPYGFFPDKGIFVGACFQFCPINKDSLFR